MFLLDPFFWEVIISGLLAGVMYALVALGFVLIFKASGIFNFAQGVLALFAAVLILLILPLVNTSEIRSSLFRPLHQKFS